MCSSQAIVFYDYIDTFPEEVNTLWRRKKSLTSIVLLINRYALLAFAFSAVAELLPLTGNPFSDPVCAY